MPTDPKNPKKAYKAKPTVVYAPQTSPASIPTTTNYFIAAEPSFSTEKNIGTPSLSRIGDAQFYAPTVKPPTTRKNTPKPKPTGDPVYDNYAAKTAGGYNPHWTSLDDFATTDRAASVERDVRDHRGTEPLSKKMPTVRDVRAGLGIGLLAVPGLAAGLLAPEVLGVSGLAGILTGGAASAIEQLGQDKLLDLVDPKPKYFHPDGTPILVPGSYAELKADQAAFRKKNPLAAEAMANIVQLPFTNVFSSSIKDRAASALIGGASAAGTGYVGRLIDGKPTTSDDFWSEVSKGSATGFTLPSSSGEGEGYKRQVRDGIEGPQSAQRIKPTARPTTELDTWRATDPTPAPTTESSYKIIPWRFTEPVPQQRVPAPKKATVIDKADSVLRSASKDIQAANAALRTVHGMGEAPLDARVATQENIMPRDPQVRPLTIKTPQKSLLPIVRSAPRLPNPDARVAPGFREVLVAPRLPQKVTTPNTLSTRAGGWKEVGRSGTDTNSMVIIKNAQGKQETISARTWDNALANKKRGAAARTPPPW